MAYFRPFICSLTIWLESMSLKALIVFPILSALSMSVACAADVISTPDSPPIVAVPAFNWGGSYTGFQAGYAFGTSKHKAASEADAQNGIAQELSGSNLRSNGFLGGIYSGYNFEANNGLVLGVEADAAYAGWRAKHREIGDNDTIVTGKKIIWTGAVRARAGYALDRFMPFISGGLAIAQVQDSVYLNQPDPTSDFAPNIYLKQRRFRAGYTLGAGVDYAFNDNTIMRLEYRFTDLGKQSLAANNASTSNRLQSNEIRMGIAYKF